MTATTSPLPARRMDLRIEPHGPDGDHVVKEPGSGRFFLLGKEEHALLLLLDGRRDATAVQDAFARTFGEPLGEEDLGGFLDAARAQGLLASSAAPPPPRQSVLSWRRGLWDPDRSFSILERRLRFLWTRPFVLLCGAAVLLAALIVWNDREELLRGALAALRWDTILLGSLALLALGVLHECAHGLTCKHYGGEVREIGILFLFFMPCFFCNVSDAWLFREKRKRLWVMLAGVCCDLVVWALAVFVWRLTETDTLLHRIAFLVLGLSGLDTLFNLNPLIKLDGYYLLSDWQEIPNLRERALARAKAHARRLLWGAPPPGPEPRSRFLGGFGLLSLVFSAGFLVVTLVVIGGLLHGWVGAAGYVAAAALALPAGGQLLGGLAGGELTEMVMKRRIRTCLWLLALAAVGAGLCLLPVNEHAGGSFSVRCAVREEVRGRSVGFLAEVLVDEGTRVLPGDLIARIEVPGLDARVRQKQAEIREAQAQLRLLEAGTRAEEIAEQEARVERALRWHDRARHDLDRMRSALEEELAAFEGRLQEARIQRDAHESDYVRVHALYTSKVASQEELERADHARRVAGTRISLAEAEKRARAARGTALAEEELGRRELDVEEARARLALLRAGPRPEEIAAQRARIDRLQAEAGHLEQAAARLEVRSTVAGVIMTPRLRERSGEHLGEGDLICVVEEPSSQWAEITLDEQKVRDVRPGQRVRLKARALPFETIEGRVTCLAPCAGREEGGGRAAVVVRCSIDHPSPVLRTSMSGHARIHTGRRPVGAILLDRLLRLLRTEFWW